LCPEPLYSGRRQQQGGSRTGSTLSLAQQQQQQQQLTGLASHVVAYHFCQVTKPSAIGCGSNVYTFYKVQCFWVFGFLCVKIISKTILEEAFYYYVSHFSSKLVFVSRQNLKINHS
jgi:hypothetical protein